MAILRRLLNTNAPAAVFLVWLMVGAHDEAPHLAEPGFWDMAHAARTDFAMLLGSISLPWIGGGSWSVDARLRDRAK